MSNIYKTVCDTLEPLGYPLSLQGSYADNAIFPETFITYQLIDSQNNSHADNLPTSTTHRIQLSLYSKKPVIQQGADTTLKSVMLPSGFVRAGGRDLPFNQDTGHYGYTCDYRYFETEE